MFNVNPLVLSEHLRNKLIPGGIDASLPASSLVTLILLAGLEADGRLERPSFFSDFTWATS